MVNFNGGPFDRGPNNRNGMSQVPQGNPYYDVWQEMSSEMTSIEEHMSELQDSADEIADGILDDATELVDAITVEPLEDAIESIGNETADEAVEETEEAEEASQGYGY